jgi:hypothetical protein
MLSKSSWRARDESGAIGGSPRTECQYCHMSQGPWEHSVESDRMSRRKGLSSRFFLASPLEKGVGVS